MVNLPRKGSGTVVRAKCYRSMRKNEEPHRLSVYFDPSAMEPSISAFQCSCAAGQGLCQHVIGLLYTLSHYQMMGFKSVPPVVSKTSKPQVGNRQIKLLGLSFILDLNFILLYFYLIIKHCHTQKQSEGKS